MPITSETPSSVEQSSGCNISEATSGQNAHNIRDAIERGGEQRRKKILQKVLLGISPCDCPRGQQSGKCWRLQRMLILDSRPCPSGQGSQRSCAHQATSVSYLGSVEESGQELRMSDSGSCEEHDESISGQSGVKYSKFQVRS